MGPFAIFASVVLGTGYEDDCTGDGCSCEEECGPGKDKMAGRGNTCNKGCSDKDVQWDTEERGQLCRTTSANGTRAENRHRQK